MTTQHSFTGVEKTHRAALRERLDQAESTQDARRFFFQTVRDFLDEIEECDVDLTYEAIELTPDREPGFEFNREFMDNKALDCLEALMRESDLDRILGDFAETAVNRYRRLDTNPEKTEAKMWPVPGGQANR